MKALVVVDMQNDFIDGSLGSQEAAKIVPAVVKRIAEFDGIIAVTQDTHHNAYLETQEGRNLPVPHCMKGTDGWQLNNDVFAILDNMAMEHGVRIEVFDKPTFGSIELADWLVSMDRREHLEEITLIGLCTDICVISNAMIIKAFLPESKIIIDSNCCAGVTKESHTNALLAMKNCQIEIQGDNL